MKKQRHTEEQIAFVLKQLEQGTSLYKPCISHEIDLFERKGGGGFTYNKTTKSSFSLGKTEYAVIKKMDGTRTADEISKLFESVSMAEIDRIINDFEKVGFIKGKEQKARTNILKVKIRLFNPDKYLKQEGLFIKLLYYCIVYLTIPIFLIGILIATLNNINLLTLNVSVVLGTLTLPLCMLIVLVSISLHEMAHAFVAKYNGAIIPEIGIMLYWFMPCAYTSIGGISSIQSKYKRITFKAAGVLLNLQLVGWGLISLSFVSGRISEILIGIIYINAILFISNLLIFLKLDGYYILEEILDIKSLREKSFLYLCNIGKRLYNKKKTSKDDFIDSMVYSVYGVLSILYIPITISMVIFAFFGHLNS